ncbi:MAG: hypothetical protein IT181_05710 [Acidobacteria bacterium]|nr:hypothetical protein [Acidobacteriota bacterium]
MRPGPGTFARIRPVAGPLLLALFVIAAQLAPARHLAAHRGDHTHGPERPSPLDGAADDSAPHEHEHDEDADHDHGGWFAMFGSHHGGNDHDDAAAHDHDAASGRAGADHDHEGSAPAAPHRHSNEHGQSSAAHFGLALLQGPPPPFLPPPSSTLAAPLVAAPLGHVATPRRQPPARGPPRFV